MTQPMPVEPHEGIKADANPETQAADAPTGSAPAASSGGVVSTGPEPGDEQPSQAKTTGTAGGDALAGVTADPDELKDAVSGDTGPERPGQRSS